MSEPAPHPAGAVAGAAPGIAPGAWGLLGVAVLAQITVSIVTQGVPTLAPFLQSDLSLTRAQVGLFNSAIMGGSFLSLFAAGWVVDLKGERAALVWGNVLVGLACIAVVITRDFAGALAVFFCAGIGASFPTPAGSRTVMRWFPPAQRGTAIGIRQTGIPIGGALAAAALPWLALIWGWRWAIAVGGLSCLAAAAVCGARYPAASDGPPVPGRLADLFRFRDVLNRDVVLLGLAGALLPLGQFALVTYLALYLKETQGIAITVTATMLVFAQLAGAAGRVLWGIWSDRVFQQRRKPSLVLANLLAALFALVLGWLPVATPLPAIYLLVVVLAFNAIGWHGSWIAIAAEIAGPAQQGRTIAAGMTIMYGGIIMLPPLFGAFVDHTHSWRWAWTLLAAALVLGVALVAPIDERRARTA